MNILPLIVLIVVAVVEFKLGQKYERELQVEQIDVTDRIADHV